MVRHVTEGQVGDRLEVERWRRLSSRRPWSRCRRSPRRSRSTSAVLDYAMRLVRATRTWSGVAAGAGPRGGIAIVRAARAAALIAGRDFVTPDDVKRMALPALRHRIMPSPELELEGQRATRS